MAATCQHKRQIASSQAAFVTAAAVLASVDEERSNLGIPAGICVYPRQTEEMASDVSGIQYLSEALGEGAEGLWSL